MIIDFELGSLEYNHSAALTTSLKNSSNI